MKYNHFMRKEKKLDGEKDVDQVELLPKEIERIDEVGNKLATSPLLSLQPQEHVKFRLKKKVYLNPGSYRGKVGVRSFMDDGAPRHRVYGAMVAKAGPFRVTMRDS